MTGDGRGVDIRQRVNEVENRLIVGEVSAPHAPIAVGTVGDKRLALGGHETSLMCFAGQELAERPHRATRSDDTARQRFGTPGPFIAAGLLERVIRGGVRPRKALDFPHHSLHPLRIHKRRRQPRTRIFRRNFTGHTPQTAHFHLAPECVVFVPLWFRAVHELQPAAIHLHAGHCRRRLIGGHGASCGDRQGVVGRGLRITLRHAFVANPLRRAAHAFRRNVQFGERLAENSPPACRHRRPSSRPSGCSHSPRPDPGLWTEGKKARRQPGQ